MSNQQAVIDKFIATIAQLRGPDGCPWDRKQDHQSLSGYVLEEAYEVLAAIYANEPQKLKEELGDLLLQIVLHCQIASEQRQFDFDDVVESINKKMIDRHPHVFGGKNLETAQQVVAQWHELKAKEAKDMGAASAIDGVSDVMPALMQSLKISQKAAACGFEWSEEDEVWKQLESELVELSAAMHSDAAPQKEIELELGDVIFCLVNVARWRDLDPEAALLRALDKFKRRFRVMEQMSEQPLSDLSKEHLEDLWVRAKTVTSAAATN